MSDRISLWETFRQPLLPDDSHFADCKPDLHVPDLLDLDADMIANLGVQHVFIDFDGTMAVNGNLPPITDQMTEHVRTLAADSRFDTFSIATDNRTRYMESIAASIGSHVRLFQPKETPKGPVTKFSQGFWNRLLFETDIWESPESAVMIGDSMCYDIVPAQESGMKAVLVDRMEKRMASNSQERLAELRSRRIIED